MAKIYLIIGMILSAVLSGNAQSVQSKLSFPIKEDSVVSPASTHYAPASFLRKLFTGKNYRKEWTTPVKMPVFDLERTGLKIIKMGGGQQTKSLRLVDKQGREWALRTVEKFAEGAVPRALKNTLAEKVVQDMISASYPYAALTVGQLAQAVQVTAPKPVLYFVPDAEFLGEYRSHFANMVCFLELREPKPGAKDTEDIMQESIKDHDNLFMQKEILKARLLDMLVADWDRHEGQWLWVSQDSAGAHYYSPVPLDRDQAFFMSDGLISRFAKIWALPHINSFKKQSKKLKRLSYKSWEFDKYFLNDLSSEEWKSIIQQFQNNIPDPVIDAAVRNLPPEIYAISGREVAGKLKSRRDGLLKNAMEYYEFLTTAVNVTGSNKEEIFWISSDGDGMMVRVFRAKNGEQGSKIYERRFLPAETKLVSIYGLEGNDQFIVDESTTDDIRLKIYGDKGKDSYNIKGKGKSRIYDTKTENNLLVNVGSARVIFED